MHGPVAVVLADDAVRRAADALAAAGYEVVEAEVPRLEETAQLWLDLVGFEVRLGALQRLREEGSDGTRRSAEALFWLARPLDGAGYAQALAERHALAAQWPHQLVLGPVSTAAPWPVGHDLGGAGRAARRVVGLPAHGRDRVPGAARGVRPGRLDTTGCHSACS